MCMYIYIYVDKYKKQHLALCPTWRSIFNSELEFIQLRLYLHLPIYRDGKVRRNGQNDWKLKSWISATLRY